ncbi:hypothetical protein HPB50_002595 [Hyalomma asiaticum]|uniref:Uncharacterized protein n=1 Tax=Hyalomma asiaticum TaxID=266040 RepID=A0ACB7SE93_HYAAI|nr:hypothetical protein HPB50_002595 [Hyalomma asiaticum]
MIPRRWGQHYTKYVCSIFPHSGPTSQRTTRTAGSRDHRRTACLAARRHCCCCCCDGCDICLRETPRDGSTVAKRRHRSVVRDVGPDSQLKGDPATGDPANPATAVCFVRRASP